PVTLAELGIEPGEIGAVEISLAAAACPAQVFVTGDVALLSDALLGASEGMSHDGLVLRSVPPPGPVAAHATADFELTLLGAGYGQAALASGSVLGPAAMRAAAAVTGPAQALAH
ncbi:MAG: hypothetical protein HY744_00500, partial [Deltaproteobacteria bacterium]|nr:hypothetical protein [Deltaproteobacteria bacterium]